MANCIKMTRCNTHLHCKYHKFVVMCAFIVYIIIQLPKCHGVCTLCVMGTPFLCVVRKYNISATHEYCNKQTRIKLSNSKPNDKSNSRTVVNGFRI